MAAFALAPAAGSATRVAAPATPTLATPLATPQLEQPKRLAAAALAGLAIASIASRRRLPRRRPQALPDGTNEEGEEVAPLEWALDEVDDIVLYQQEMSPPCVKLRTMFRYFGLPFRTVNGRHPTSDYKKIPVLVINDRQINDSHVIIKTIVPWFTGQQLTPEEINWEKRITYEFQPAFEVELVGNERDVALLWARATNFIGGWQRGVIGLVSPILRLVVESLFKSRYPNMELPSSKFGLSFRAAMGDKDFFHGDKCGPIDLSLFGTYAAFAECNATARFLQASNLEDWHKRMTELGVGDGQSPRVYSMT
ncbi:unnamed protein product [Effrenium voratum]|uniref:Thioredoxin-like fold domain-containing protein n=1 Tax=Effrenium voratum TaxID=2562239 RepID=A0AA36JAR1_9DINO|nr:unnamed protein product [Effrenium voratum]CAJ1401634.1 unnamed protein product [Effrenium voratum]CAJ1448550.1 unnamed protein product [Effrenium voratum]